MRHPVWLPNSNPNPTERCLFPMKGSGGGAGGTQKSCWGGGWGWGERLAERSLNKRHHLGNKRHVAEIVLAQGGQGESKCACVAWAISPERRETQRSQSWPEAIRRRAGYSPWLLWEKKPSICHCPSSHLYWASHSLWSCTFSGAPRPCW